jgi:restriction system protein
LIDGGNLAEKLKELGIGIRTEKVEQVYIEKDWFNTV